MIRKALVLLALPAIVHAQSVLIDFGNDTSYRGTNVVNPDGNGNVWNSVDASQYWPDMRAVNGTTTTVGFGFGSAGNTDYFNGPSGATEDPAAVEIDASALGLLGANEAAYDYFASSTFTIQGLDPAKTYTLTFFGSKKYADDPTTVYTVYSSNDYLEVVASAELDVATPAQNWLHNSNQVAQIKNVAPQFANSLWIGYQGSTGGVGYLNALLIEEYVPPAPEAMTFLIDFGSDASFNGTNVISPDGNGNHWNSMAYAPASLINITGGVSSAFFTWQTIGDNDSFNGPAGTNRDPALVEIDAATLADLGVREAAYDYFASSVNTASTFVVNGLEPGLSYTLTFYGSHKFGASTTTTYTVFTGDALTNEVASTTLNMYEPGSPWLHNSNNLAVIENITVQRDGGFRIGFQGENEQPGYLNAMKIELYQTPPAADVDFIGATMDTSSVAVAFIGAADVQYALQYTTNLLATNAWLSIPGATITGDGLTTNLLSDTNLTDVIRAYRLIAAP